MGAPMGRCLREGDRFHVGFFQGEVLFRIPMKLQDQRGEFRIPLQSVEQFEKTTMLCLLPK